MKQILILTAIIIILSAVIVIFTSRETEKDKYAKERYNKAAGSQQKCVHILNNGEYSYKSLAWKLDKCGVPK